MTKTVSIKVPMTLFRQIKGNVSRFFRDAAVEKLTRTPPPAWKPTTARGRKLLALSNKFKGERLDAEGINRELRERSGLRG